MEDRFEEVYRRAYPRLVGLAWQVVRDRSAAEDVAQESLERLAQAAVLERPDGEVDAWLTRVCVNRACNELRSRSRSSNREDRAGREALAVSEDPAGDVVAREERNSVRAVLTQLPERQQVVLILRHSGYSYAEIAAAVGIAPGSVGTLLARAEHAFRRTFVPATTEHEEEETSK